MTSVEIRVLDPAELPRLVATFGQLEYFTGRLERQAAGAGEVFVAWLNGRAVGDVSLIREPVPEAEVRERLPAVPQISHLEVDEPYRRLRIASALLDAAEAHAHALGHGLIGLGVGVTNAPARRLYDQRGYDDWGNGLVTFRWTVPGPDGELVPDSEVCHVLVKLLDPDVPPLTAWAAWEPAEAAERLRKASTNGVVWAVAGGWAVDLHLGRRTREHSDLEIALPRGQFPMLRPYLRGFDLYDVGDGRVRRLGPDELPDPENHQVWVSEPAVPAWRMDTFLEPGDEQTWVSHRDPRLTMPLRRAVRHTDDGIPYLAPEIILFTKAKHARPKDEADLDQLLPRLTEPARDWMVTALELVHPGHAWLGRLQGTISRPH